MASSISAPTKVRRIFNTMLNDSRRADPWKYNSAWAVDLDRALKAIALTARKAERRQAQQDHDDLTGEHLPAPAETP